jgi:hypothetical protein
MELVRLNFASVQFLFACRSCNWYPQESHISLNMDPHHPCVWLDQYPPKILQSAEIIHNFAE